MKFSVLDRFRTETIRLLPSISVVKLATFYQPCDARMIHRITTYHRTGVSFLHFRLSKMAINKEAIGGLGNWCYGAAIYCLPALNLIPSTRRGEGGMPNYAKNPRRWWPHLAAAGWKLFRSANREY